MFGEFFFSFLTTAYLAQLTRLPRRLSGRGPLAEERGGPRDERRGTHERLERYSQTCRRNPRKWRIIVAVTPSCEIYIHLDKNLEWNLSPSQFKQFLTN